MTESDIIENFSNVRAWKNGDRRAPHKPLLILYALAQLQKGNKSISFSDSEEELKELLVSYGTSSKPRPEYPFVRLQNDGIWSVDKPELLTNKSSDPGRPFLIENNISGGFNTALLEFFDKHPESIFKIANQVLEESFPDSLQEEILNTVGLEENNQTATRRKKRDLAFRDKVLIAYEYQCAVCGFNVRLGHQPLALEAAHIKWHQAGGPDVQQNGFAMCSLHHKLFDLGAFTINRDHQLIVSDRVNGTVGKDEWLLAFHTKEIRKPHSHSYQPNDSFLQWHEEEVFKGYGRD
ncbi:putative restriction endonuclease [Roseivirga pacifica]|uniref:Putative restriction endonuclease n=1 Tax=Roseivirga pacifica TaxID=1267423 RepID=A0A1I0MWG5_9BACT|nr:HNH endonuclease [Roseivirga pacifica]RKQ50748.1 putative restriction endonuclease [Roseivirga pacifica]SEV92972.1 putative restriction endonuclease [Roseivirga pacifica]